MHFIIYGMFFIQRRAKRYDFCHRLLICHIAYIGWLYFDLICSNLISIPEINLNPVEFGWNSVDSVFLPNKCIFTLPEMYTVTFGCKKKCTARCQCSKLVSVHFMRRILQVHWKIKLYLSLPIDSVGRCITYANIKVFSDLHCPVYGQNPRTYTRKYVSEETRIFLY